MKKVILCILLLLSLMLAACGNSAEYTPAEDKKETTPETVPVARDLSWIITNGTLTIEGNGAIPDFGHDSVSPWDAEKDNITRVVISKGITRIGDKAFYYCDNLSYVSIPKSVTSIGDHAFRYCKKLAAVQIPKQVTSIGDYAFGDCWSLESIAIYQNVEHIGTAAFSNCKALREISVESTNQNYSSENGILFNKDKTALIRYPAEGGRKAYSIPDSVTVIESGAFESCSNLEHVVIPSSVTRIGNFAFSGCFHLTSLFIPGSVTEIGWDAFDYCYELMEIDVAVSNPNYASENGLFLTKDRKTLLLYPRGRSVNEISIPESVTKIGGGAFECNDKLVSFSVPQGVTAIDAWAFWSCDRLETVWIPGSVTSIGASAFDSCESLKTITFDGTTAQWESIEKEGFSDNSFTVSCTDGNVQVN